jgi:release factor glutamine methyltransferase
MSSNIPNIKECIALASKQLVNSPSSQLDAEVILAYVLKKGRSYLRTWPEKQLSTEEFAQFNRLVQSRQNGKPIAYIIGEREFWSHAFCVNPNVLIPRPDTELLINTTLGLFPSQAAIQIADLGTGSGAIAISLGLEFPNAKITAIDNSVPALRVAKKNASRLQSHNVTFIKSDWLDTVDTNNFDIIISNPPYIDSGDKHLNEGDVKHEPKSALIAQENGLQDIKTIASEAKKHLNKSGFLLLEHGFQQGNSVKTLLESRGYDRIQQLKDIQGHTRATLCQFN